MDEAARRHNEKMKRIRWRDRDDGDNTEEKV